MHHLGDVQYFPLALPFFVLLAGALLLLLALVQIQVLRYAYLQLGVSPEAALLLLAGSLFDSYVNIPIAVLGHETMVAEGQVTYFGMRYVVPKIVSQDVILAINVGGAIIPTLLSIYLLSRNRLWEPGLIAVACVAAVCNHFAEPVHGIGIAIPIFLAPLAAVTTAAVASWRDVPVLSYVAGSLGVLIGADILNLDKIRGLGTPVASIRGAGTFDGIFVTGIVAVLLAGLLGANTTARARSPRYRETARLEGKCERVNALLRQRGSGLLDSC